MNTKQNKSAFEQIQEDRARDEGTIPQASETPKPVEKVTIPHDKLMLALFWLWDAFDRALIHFFLVGKTAEDAIAQKKQENDKVEIGVRRMEWKSGSTPILKAFMGEPLVETENHAEYFHNTVPVYIYFFDDDPTVTSIDSFMYMNDNFSVPNPYSKFIERFGTSWK